jgi:hypothetical protein
MGIRKSSFYAKNRAIQADFSPFLSQNCHLGRIGKRIIEHCAGSDFHPLGERNAAGGAHVKILNPIKSCVKGCCCDP